VKPIALMGRVEDRLRSSRDIAFIVLWFVLIAQVVWTVYYIAHARPAFADIYYPVIFTPAAAVLAITHGRVRWWATIPRLLIGLGFLDNVADRLGFLGPPGAAGVSWGDFQHFIAYTAQVNVFAPAAIVPALAVLATIGESAFGLTMLLGMRIPLAAAGSALLLFVFATAMVLSGLSQFQYSVYLMSVTAWALATIGASALSVDNLLRHSAGQMPVKAAHR
jgi:putative oxidoreductase